MNDSCMPQLKALTQELHDEDHELALSERLLGGILDGMRDAVMVIDNEGLVVWLNQSARRLFGDYVIGKRHAEIGDIGALLASALELAIEDGGRRDRVGSVAVGDGTRMRIWATVSAGDWGDNGRPETVIEVVRDMSHCAAGQANA